MRRNAFVAPVDRATIYERDGYTCQLCGEQVDLDAEPLTPLAPVLDHIVPLSAGGTEEPGNVQLAHHRCNSLKRSRLDLNAFVTGPLAAA